LGRDYAFKFTFAANKEHNPSRRVYAAMKERLFHWDNVKKNRKTGEFEELK
jgi:hypothetical protein